MKKHYGGNLNISNINQEVELFGWIANKRKFKNLLFIDLRDSTGIVQLVMQNVSDSLLTKESCIKAKGIVRKRLEVNNDLKSGEIEVLVNEYEIFNSSKQIPFEINNKLFSNANEDLRLEYRFLDLRQEKMYENLKLRHKLLLEIRKYFDKLNFIEIETPILGKSTPEGARDYLVPTRRKGKFFALPQSPQLFKQLLMAGGVEKYFQIARVFRDEDLRKDRQPEFTQLDIEMSFSNQEEIFNICEKMWKQVLTEMGFNIETPFPRMNFKYSMEHYGNDKPDTRFNFLINDYSKALTSHYNKKFVHAIVFDRNIEEHLKNIKEIFKKNNGDVLDIIDLKTNPGILNFFENEIEKEAIKHPFAIISAGDDKDNVLKALGAIRTLLNEIYKIADDNQLNFLWIVNWPMFEYDKETNEFTPAHHAFTQIDPKTSKYLESGELEKVQAQSYDLVLNGFELGSGSIRIHNRKEQQKMFDILKLSEREQQKRFGFFLKAFDYGLPPHNGIAFGIERVLMILTKANSIRDVIAFPKNAKGIDLLLSAPSEISKEQLEEYGLKAEK